MDMGPTFKKETEPEIGSLKEERAEFGLEIFILQGFKLQVGEKSA
jgi:hypothetical protein